MFIQEEYDAIRLFLTILAQSIAVTRVFFDRLAVAAAIEGDKHVDDARLASKRRCFHLYHLDFFQFRGLGESLCTLPVGVVNQIRERQTESYLGHSKDTAHHDIGERGWRAAAEEVHGDE